MNYSFHEAAEEEFFAAIEYYEQCQSGLGLRFSEIDRERKAILYVRHQCR